MREEFRLRHLAEIENLPPCSFLKIPQSNDDPPPLLIEDLVDLYERLARNQQRRCLTRKCFLLPEMYKKC